MDIRYIEPGSQPVSFIEEAAVFGVKVACWMAGAMLMYWFLDMCLKAF